MGAAGFKGGSAVKRLILGICFFCHISLPAIAEERLIVREGVVGCKSREYFEALADYSAKNDQHALQQKLTAGIVTGRCVYFTQGETVVVLESAPFSGLLKVQKKGVPGEFWMAIDAAP